MKFSSLTLPLRQRSMQAGMSIIEIIIVVALIGTLMTIIIRNVSGTAEKAKEDQTKIALNLLQQDMQLYKVHCNKYPPDLNAMLTAPADAKCWRGPYSEAGKLKDPWGNDFGYESDGRNFKIRSGGANQTMGDADDIVFPEETGSNTGG